MPATCFHLSTDDLDIERRINDTLHAADVDDDTDELDDEMIARLDRCRTSSVYFKSDIGRSMRKSYVRR